MKIERFLIFYAEPPPILWKIATSPEAARMQASGLVSQVLDYFFLLQDIFLQVQDYFLKVHECFADVGE